MKRILITGAGGTPSTNFVRSLRMSPEKFFLIGVDCDEYYLERAETDLKYLVPETKDKYYIPVLKQIIKETRTDFIYSQPDPEIAVISQNRNSIGAKTFLPTHRTIEICQSKLESYIVWKEAGLKVPRTIRLNGISDLKEAFSKFGKPVWLRAIVSYGGGKDSFYTSDFEVAKAWIRHCNGWGNFTASEYLSPDSVTWLSLWKDGELIVAQGRKRLYWEFGNRAPSGVTGLTGTGVTVSDQIVDKLAQKVIFAIDKEPNGIFAVDLTYDKKGVPNPTEINIGRFFTTHLFFTQAGLNLPYIFVKLAFGEKPPKIKKKINPLAEGLAWVRGMDFLPILTNVKAFEKSREALKNRIAKIKE
ncbi:MAG: carboxylate--amine ligase [Candidatus Omnitrophota bacterium]